MLIQYCDICGILMKEDEHKKNCKDCRSGKTKPRFQPSDSGRLPIATVTAMLKNAQYRPPRNVLEN